MNPACAAAQRSYARQSAAAHPPGCFSSLPGSPQRWANTHAQVRQGITSHSDSFKPIRCDGGGTTPAYAHIRGRLLSDVFWLIPAEASRQYNMH